MPKIPKDLTEAEVRAAAAKRRKQPRIPPPAEAKDNPPTPEPDGPYSHGHYGVLESDNQDKPYIERRSDPFGIDAELFAQEAMEAAERRR